MKETVRAGQYEANDFGGVQVALREGSYQQAIIYLEGFMSDRKETQKQLIQLIDWTEREIWLLRQELSTMIQ